MTSLAAVSSAASMPPIDRRCDEVIKFDATTANQVADRPGDGFQQRRLSPFTLATEITDSQNKKIDFFYYDAVNKRFCLDTKLAPKDKSYWFRLHYRHDFNFSACDDFYVLRLDPILKLGVGQLYDKVEAIHKKFTEASSLIPTDMYRRGPSLVVNYENLLGLASQEHIEFEEINKLCLNGISYPHFIPEEQRDKILAVQKQAFNQYPVHISAAELDKTLEGQSHDGMTKTYTNLRDILVKDLDSLRAPFYPPSQEPL